MDQEMIMRVRWGSFDERGSIRSDFSTRMRPINWVKVSCVNLEQNGFTLIWRCHPKCHKFNQLFFLLLSKSSYLNNWLFQIFYLTTCLHTIQTTRQYSIRERKSKKLPQLRYTNRDFLIQLVKFRILLKLIRQGTLLQNHSWRWHFSFWRGRESKN